VRAHLSRTCSLMSLEAALVRNSAEHHYFFSFMFQIEFLFYSCNVWRVELIKCNLQSLKKNVHVTPYHFLLAGLLFLSGCSENILQKSLQLSYNSPFLWIGQVSNININLCQHCLLKHYAISLTISHVLQWPVCHSRLWMKHEKHWSIEETLVWD